MQNPTHKEQANSGKRFRRFLYLSNEENCYVTGNAESHKAYVKEKLTCLDQLTATQVNLQPFLNRRLPQKEALFFVLSQLITSDHHKNERHIFYKHAMALCKSDADLFLFVKFITLMNKSFSSGLMKVIQRYYSGKGSDQLAKSVCKRKGYHRWTHKDLFKLSHLSTEKNQKMAVIVKYIMKGMKDAETMAGDDEELKKLTAIFKRAAKFHTCTDENRVIDLINEFRFEYQQVPKKFRKSERVWECLIRHMKIQDVFKHLSNLHRMGLLKPESKVTQILVKMLTDPGAISSSKITPYEAFIALKTFENGGKPRDPKLIKYLEEQQEAKLKEENSTAVKKDFTYMEPIVCAHISDALNVCIRHAHKNLKPAKKRVLITMETGQAMEAPCLTTKSISCHEAGVFIIYSFLQLETDVTVAVFSGDTIQFVPIESSASMDAISTKLKTFEASEVNLLAPINWAIQESKPIDLFVDVCWTSCSWKSVRETITKYNKINKGFKAVFLNLGKFYSTALPDEILDIRGFDKNIPLVIEAFLKDYH